MTILLLFFSSIFHLTIDEMTETNKIDSSICQTGKVWNDNIVRYFYGSLFFWSVTGHCLRGKLWQAAKRWPVELKFYTLRIHQPTLHIAALGTYSSDCRDTISHAFWNLTCLLIYFQCILFIGDANKNLNQKNLMHIHTYSKLWNLEILSSIITKWDISKL